MKDVDRYHIEGGAVIKTPNADANANKTPSLDPEPYPMTHGSVKSVSQPVYNALIPVFLIPDAHD